MEYGIASPGYYVPMEDASTQVSDEDFMQEEPTREESTQTFEEEFPPLIPTREASTQTSENDSNCPLEINGGNEYENFTNSDSSFQNKSAHDFDWYTDENQNSLQANSNTIESEFHNPSYGICYSLTSSEAMDDSNVASNQTYLCESSLVSECKNKYNSDEMLRMQSAIERPALINNAGKFDFMSSAAYESIYPTSNNSSDFSDNVQDRHEKGDIERTLSFLPAESPSNNKRFQKNATTGKTVARQKPRTYEKRTKRVCRKCKKYFMWESTFKAHKQSNCNIRPYKCSECDEIFGNIHALLRHRRVHTGEKPFKCIHCEYTSAWPYDLNKHLKKHAKK